MHLCAWTIIFAFSIFISSKVNGQARFFPDHSVERLKMELIEALDALKNMPMETLTFNKFFLWIEEAKRPANEAMGKHMCNSLITLPGNGEWHGCDLAKKWLAEMKIAKDSGHKKLIERKAKFAEKDAYLRNLVDTWTAPLPACPPWWPFPSPWCQQEIDPLKEPPSPSPSFCLEDKVPGPCEAFFPRFYYDEKTGICERFIYGGCEGNNNNFKTFDECQNVCQASLQRRPKSCYEDKIVGPCRAKILRFYYDDKSGKCQRFFYGGCLGNKNNFRTDLECQKTCDAKE